MIRTRRHALAHVARRDEHAFRILLKAALEPMQPSPRCEERVMAALHAYKQYTWPN